MALICRKRSFLKFNKLEINTNNSNVKYITDLISKNSDYALFHLVAKMNSKIVSSYKDHKNLNNL